MMKKLRYISLLPFFIYPLLYGAGKWPPETRQIDGPYVFYSGQQLFVQYILENGNHPSVQLDSFQLADKSQVKLTVDPGNGFSPFTIALKNKHVPEKAEYRKVKKQLAISDMEGNFPGFIKLLKACNVIDDDYNWIWGDGHLVLTGDFFDRGTQVTELLWFIYALETKARAAGGYVHFVLGNHEIMNLNGDFRYVHPRYMEHAALMQKNYLQLFDENTELGRWLRSKNIVEKIGDVLYTHGGISQDINRFEAPAPVINELARPWYGDTSYNYPNIHVELLYSEVGPFWYRGYYTGTKRAGLSQIDSTLNIFNARHIVTGHTIAADTISTWYKSRIFNLDVPHFKGFSEALLIENGHFYRISVLGKKTEIGG